MVTVRISEIEAARDFANLLARVRSGEKFIIEADGKPVAILESFYPVHRTIDETLALLRERTKERGHELIMDDDFAADVSERIRNRQPRDRSYYEQFD